MLPHPSARELLTGALAVMPGAMGSVVGAKLLAGVALNLKVPLPSWSHGPPIRFLQAPQPREGPPEVLTAAAAMPSTALQYTWRDC